MKQLLLIVSLACVSFTILASSKINEVRWVTPSWRDYVNPDGSGIYNEIIFDIFKSENIKVTQIITPWKRALMMVEKGKADFTGADLFDNKYYLPEYPIIKNSEVVLFKTSSISSVDSAQQLSGLTGVWVLGYLDTIPLEIKRNLKGFSTRSRQNALKMLLTPSRKVDYYFDNSYQLMQTIKATQTQISPNDYSISKMFDEELFLLFHKSERSRRIIELYEAGTRKKYCDGSLQQLYQKWSQTMPNLKIDCQKIIGQLNRQNNKF